MYRPALRQDWLHDCPLLAQHKGLVLDNDCQMTTCWQVLATTIPSRQQPSESHVWPTRDTLPRGTTPHAPHGDISASSLPRTNGNAACDQVSSPPCAGRQRHGSRQWEPLPCSCLGWQPIPPPNTTHTTQNGSCPWQRHTQPLTITWQCARPS